MGENEQEEHFRAKVREIFRELTGDRVDTLAADRAAQTVNDVIREALKEEYDILVADEIGFHLVDWNADAAFLVALHLFPERFTGEDIRVGIQALLLHVPAHIRAAARLAGHPCDDIFLEKT